MSADLLTDMRGDEKVTKGFNGTLVSTVQGAGENISVKKSLLQLQTQICIYEIKRVEE